MKQSAVLTSMPRPGRIPSRLLDKQLPHTHTHTRTRTHGHTHAQACAHTRYHIENRPKLTRGWDTPLCACKTGALTALYIYSFRGGGIKKLGFDFAVPVERPNCFALVIGRQMAINGQCVKNRYSRGDWSLDPSKWNVPTTTHPRRQY